MTRRQRPAAPKKARGPLTDSQLLRQADRDARAHQRALEQYRRAEATIASFRTPHPVTKPTN